MSKIDAGTLIRNPVAQEVEAYFDTLRRVLTVRPKDFPGVAAYALNPDNAEGTVVPLPQKARTEISQAEDITRLGYYTLALECISRAENIANAELRDQGHIYSRMMPLLKPRA